MVIEQFEIPSKYVSRFQSLSIPSLVPLTFTWREHDTDFFEWTDVVDFDDGDLVEYSRILVSKPSHVDEHSHRAL